MNCHVVSCSKIATNWFVTKMNPKDIVIHVVLMLSNDSLTASQMTQVINKYEV